MNEAVSVRRPKGTLNLEIRGEKFRLAGDGSEMTVRPAKIILSLRHPKNDISIWLIAVDDSTTESAANRPTDRRFHGAATV